VNELQASPHYHYNAVELGYFTEGRQVFSCLLDSSTAVTLNAASAPTKFYCNKLSAGSSYIIPKGWLHWLLSPCEPFEVFLTFTSADYGAKELNKLLSHIVVLYLVQSKQTIATLCAGNVNVPKAAYQAIPTSKFYPGKDTTVEEMQALYEYLGDSVSDFAFGDNHLMPGNATAGAKFCEKYGPV